MVNKMAYAPWMIQGFFREKFKGRSPEWRKVRKLHLKDNPRCVVCYTKKNLQVHHIEPFHLRPDLELNLTNLVTLCGDHHLLFGHLDYWKSWNPAVLEDCEQMAYKIETRPVKR